MNYIVSWFYLEEKGNESSYAQVSAKSTSRKFQDTYWKCIVSFYYTSIIKNKNAKHIFYTNSKNIPIVDGFDVEEFFKIHNIEVRMQELTNKTPLDWHGAWRNQFYVFDILAALSSSVNEDDSVIILDSDCIVNTELDELFKEIKDGGLVSYLIGYEKNHIINGINTLQMRELYKQFYKDSSDIEYYGGEFIGINGACIKELLREYKYLWEQNYCNYKENKIKLNEEAHFLSMLYHRLNLANDLGNKHIKRIWNGLNYNNVQENDKYLDIYHLPAQKTTGFSYFFQKIIKEKRSYTSKDLIKIFDINIKKNKVRVLKEISTKLIFKYKA